MVSWLLRRGYIIVVIVRAELLRPAYRDGLLLWLWRRRRSRVIVGGLAGSFPELAPESPLRRLKILPFDRDEARDYLLRMLQWNRGVVLSRRSLRLWIERAGILEVFRSDAAETVDWASVSHIANPVDLAKLAALLNANESIATPSGLLRRQVDQAFDRFGDPPEPAYRAGLDHLLADSRDLGPGEFLLAGAAEEDLLSVLGQERLVVFRRGAAGVEWRFRHLEYRALLEAKVAG